MRRKYLWLAVSLLLALVSVTGIILLAVSTREEEERPAYVRLQRALEDSDPYVGLAEARHYLKRFPESAPGHRALATLYDERLDMPLEAAAEYRLYLECDPSADRDEVERWITAARRRCFEQWSIEFGGVRASGGASAAEIAKLRAENAELRSRLEMLEKLLFSPAAPATAEVSVPAAPSPVEAVASAPGPGVPAGNFYVVGKGDTLGRIARNVYGESSRAAEIYNLNRDQLSSPNVLKEGMRLRLPPSVRPSAPATLPSAPIRPLSDEQKRLLEAANRGEAHKPAAASPAAAAEKKPAAAEEKKPGTASGENVTPYLY